MKFQWVHCAHILFALAPAVSTKRAVETCVFSGPGGSVTPPPSASENLAQPPEGRMTSSKIRGNKATGLWGLLPNEQDQKSTFFLNFTFKAS